MALARVIAITGWKSHFPTYMTMFTWLGAFLSISAKFKTCVKLVLMISSLHISDFVQGIIPHLGVNCVSFSLQPWLKTSLGGGQF